MSLIGLIEKLREKSDSAKMSVALVGSIILTSLVVMMWLSFVFISNKVEDNTAAVGNAKNNANSPITIVKDAF